jgi:hypothetical protein
MGVIKFFHQIFRPNCDCNICARPTCSKCEVLESQLLFERATNQQLIGTLTDLVNPKKDPQIKFPSEYKPIQTAGMPWRVKQQMMEREDRATAKLREDKERENEARKLTTEELEKELGIPDEPELPPGA